LDVDKSDDAVAELEVKYAALDHEAKAARPATQANAGNGRVRLIFDTDMGNDIDDALALAVIHALESRGECELLAVTLSKDNDFAAPFVSLVNTFYGRGQIPIGVVKNGKTPEDSKYIRIPAEARIESGALRYPHRLHSGKDAPEAVGLLRDILARQPDHSVVIAVVGFSTNLARLLDSPGDARSPLAGRELAARKCRLLVMMAGMFSDQNREKEYNVHIDLEAAKKVFADWPTPVVASGFEIGQAIKYPAASIVHDFGYVKHHPLREAYELYMKMPYDRETWDLTAVLYAIRAERGYFGLSQPGTIGVDERQITQFVPSNEGRHRYLTVTPEQVARVREALVQLASQPPQHAK
jgi:inosine-uridine nucleoside N-ribohydrolase